MIWNRRKKEKNTKKDTARMRRGWRERGNFGADLTPMITITCRVTVFASNCPPAVVKKLAEVFFGLIRAIGMNLLGFGIVQIGLSLKSHDPSQRANGFLTLAGGVIITFAKEILTLIAG